MLTIFSMLTDQFKCVMRVDLRPFPVEKALHVRSKLRSLVVVSVRPWLPPWSLALLIPRDSGRPGTSQPGLDSCPSSARAEARQARQPACPARNL